MLNLIIIQIPFGSTRGASKSSRGGCVPPLFPLTRGLGSTRASRVIFGALAEDSFVTSNQPNEVRPFHPSDSFALGIGATSSYPREMIAPRSNTARRLTASALGIFLLATACD